MKINRGYVITGTDTNVGKSIVSAMLVGALKAKYFKPIQAGLGEEETDTQLVRRLCGLPSTHIFEEYYRLNSFASPHLAAEIDGLTLDIKHLCDLPKTRYPLIVEGAGGLLVPINRSVLLIDLFRAWNLPVIVCARTSLGTINHTLLTIAALRRRSILIHGIIFVGDHHEENEKIIPELTKVRSLGRLPMLKELSSQSLKQAFDQNFQIGHFLKERA